MKETDVPQDPGNLSKHQVRELLYATDDKGNYKTALSSGWEPKSIALANSMEVISERTQEALDQFRLGVWSPIPYFMERSKMDLGILASYVGMWKWRVKRHFKPSVFQRISDKVLEKYAEAFEISLSELKNFKAD